MLFEDLIGYNVFGFVVIIFLLFFWQQNKLKEVKSELFEMKQRFNFLLQEINNLKNSKTNMVTEIQKEEQPQKNDLTSKTDLNYNMSDIKKTYVENKIEELQTQKDLQIEETIYRNILANTAEDNLQKQSKIEVQIKDNIEFGSHIIDSSNKYTASNKDTTLNKYTTSNADSKTTLENWIGKNVLGIAAVVLIFIGMVFLGILTVQYINEFGKMIALYVISTGVTVSGLLFYKKKKSVFAEIVSGCGFGCFFISVILTHLVFGMISDVTAFIILLFWISIAIFTAKKMESVTVSIVANIGMLISTMFAFQVGLHDESKLVLIVLYQAVGIAIIVVGNIFYYKKTYLLGMYTSVILILGSFLFLSKFVSTFSAEGSVLATILMIIEWIALTLFTNFIRNHINQKMLPDKSYANILHILNEVFWLGGTVYFFEILLYKQYMEWVSFFVILVVLTIYLCVLLIKGKTKKLESAYERNSVLLTVMTMMLLLSYHFIVVSLAVVFTENSMYGFIPYAPVFFILALILDGAFLYRKEEYLKKISLLTLLLDACFVCFGGYAVINACYSPIAMYLYFFIILMYIIKKIIDYSKSNKQETVDFLKISSYFFTIVSIIIIGMIEQSRFEYGYQVVLTLLILIHAALAYFNLCKSNSMKIIYQVVSNILFLLVCVHLYVKNEEYLSFLFQWLILFVTIVMVVASNLKKDWDKIPVLYQIYTALQITILILLAMNIGTGILSYPYVFSITCMLTALVSIIYGTLAKAKGFRVYGLGMVLFCVIKMVTYDISGLNTLVRVIAFIGGGIICFLISSGYQKLTGKE